ncbi:30S ribosomal protein S16 [Candidatus Saccharibacteria bacterium]|nr:30S ribosomal protein S16 [Candidatus Saccharibacteria bacterium]MCA9328352.1 30S ribosomal protein S16 [Candidatus Saccharibacteria bacterium]
MQRVGRKGHPEYRVVVQDARLTPTSGRVVARVGHYNPHSKVVTLDKEKVEYYLGNGAQPTPRVVSILKSEKVKLPDWVSIPNNDKKRSIKNAEKLRRNRPAEEVAEEAPVEETAPEVTAEEAPVEPVTEESASEEVVSEEQPTEETPESAEEKPAE